MFFLDDPEASRFAQTALGHVTREYPNKLDHVLLGEGDAQGPRALHPIFYGSHDWHSCVHGYWLLARIRRMRPNLAEADQIKDRLDAAFTTTAIAGERAYLAGPSAQGFERPYGWAWLLALAVELKALDADLGRRIEPLARDFAARFKLFLPKADYPVRTGVHSSSAFALRLALLYARREDQGLAALIEAKAIAWFGVDRDAPAWEPSGEDFLSPTLMEAELMRAVLPPTAFAPWIRRFLPAAAEGRPASLFTPARVSDRGDGKIVHLDGLNLSRAWCLRAIGDAVQADEVLSARLTRAAAAHVQASLKHVQGDYMGEHWLATFALLALEGLETA
jgi:hypothetical protein